MLDVRCWMLDPVSHVGRVLDLLALLGAYWDGWRAMGWNRKTSLEL